MKIAIPLANGKLALHFGHCEQFALVDVEVQNKKIIKRTDLIPPPHEPGLLPKWLAEHNVNLIIAGGMGQRALMLFAENNIQVLVGACSESPEKLIGDYFDGNLQLTSNVCDH